MAKKVKVLVLRTAGTNCDRETGFAFSYFGADVSFVHINALREKKTRLDQYHIFALPGGFTYGDDIASGKVLANELRLYLGEDIARFIRKKKLIIGICNGFQILVKAGILPGSAAKSREPFSQEATLTNNDSGKFEDRWTHLRSGGKCVWTEGIKDIVYFPVAHAEGKFITRDTKVLKRLKDNDQIVFRYCALGGGKPVYPQDPNGSTEHIAGLTDPTGHILGLMPHPERHFFRHHHPYWTNGISSEELGDGSKIFANGVSYVKKYLL